MKNLTGTGRMLFLCLALLLVHLGCGTGNAENDGSEEQSENKEGRDNQDELVPVETANLVVGDISDFILVSSTIETEQTVDVFPKVSGLVDAIKVEEGYWVKKGQILVELVDDDLVIAEQKAKTNYEQLKYDFGQKEALFKKEIMSQDEFENARFALELARLDWEQASLNLQNTRIAAPISGVVATRYVEVGDRIQVSTNLFSIVNTAELIAKVYVPEKEIARVKLNQRAVVTSDFITDQSFEAWVKRVNPVIDPASGTFKVTIGLKTGFKELKSGMFVNVRIVTNVHTDALLVPKDAIVYENQEMFVFRVNDSEIASKVSLTPGFENSDYIEILEGLSLEDRIIVAGQSGLKDQTKVRVVNKKDSVATAQ